MAGQRKRISAELKAKVAMEALKDQKSANEIAAKYGVHPVQVSAWKKQALENMASVFGQTPDKAAKENEALTERLYSQIGQLKVELDWLKKKSSPFIT